MLVPSIEHLGGILECRVNAWLVRRVLPERVVDTCRAIANEPLQRSLEIAPGTSIAPIVDGLPPEASETIGADARHLTAIFLAITNRRSAQVRLESVSCDACRKFHVDYVRMRMLVTYAGPGTELVANGDARREYIGRADLGFDEANRAIVPNASRVIHAREGDIVLLKGEAFEGNAGNGAVHRSPPIEERGERRLMLKIDLPGSY
ncbi:DUF1826 domain-containing protein [Sandaracinus amylolyticus]|uniref:DUF1826 domain-containing protein n=1 Tax=Sandaracinus amylolyticus TaxID=927083 RepID=UPI001F47404D|nr:DUF1826 domain-containing protein [Sandaracinus amylolyticus]UJR80509.1 Hypothetical protein I5071_25560 [Sandaracinus amylolyticus]